MTIAKRAPRQSLKPSAKVEISALTSAFGMNAGMIDNVIAKLRHISPINKTIALRVDLEENLPIVAV
jgi:hypothetical protein